MHCKDVMTICVAPKNQHEGFLIILAFIPIVLYSYMKDLLFSFMSSGRVVSCSCNGFYSYCVFYGLGFVPVLCSFIVLENLVVGVTQRPNVLVFMFLK